MSGQTKNSLVLTLGHGIFMAAIAAPMAVAGQNEHIVPIPETGHGVAVGVMHEDPASLQAARLGASDADGDGQPDFADNCSQVFNPAQYDSNGDGFGNRCDPDLDNNGFVNFVDLTALSAAFFSSPGSPNWNPHADLTGDNFVNFSDLSVMSDFFFSSPGPSGMSCAGTVPCPDNLVLDWPVPGNDADDWVINNYVDLNPGAGILDYQGGAKSYDGHRGVDIDVPTFRAMDDNFPIFAAAQGTVLALEDSNFDRNVSCAGAGPWNFVTIGHPNGWKTIYGHLKRNSVVVTVGQVVQPGQVLGVVGSSGCSTAPHLHLETHDENGNFVSPFQLGMFSNPPTYNTPIGFMDATLYNQAINNINMIKDPPDNATIIPAGTTLGTGLSMAGGDSNDSFNVRITKNGAIVAQNTFNLPGVLRHHYWWWNYTFGAAATGAHQLEIRVNGRLVRTYDFHVGPILSGFRQVRHGVAAASYQGLFNDLVANGFRPVWVDGYDVNGSTYFNVIFDKSVVNSWAAAHGQSNAQYQSFFNTQTGAGRRLVHIDTYLQGGQVRHASIFVDQIGTAWVAYHSASLATHQAQFNNLTSQGYRAAIISSVQAGGTQLFTALYDRDNVGGWVALANLSDTQYQTEFSNQAAAGRVLAYLNVYTLNGVPRFSAIWNSLVPSGWVARHNLSSSQFQNEFNTWEGAGLATRLITGYERNNVHNFGALWTN